MAKAKEIIGLECEGDVGLGVRLVLQARLEEMCALRAGALDWSDIEGVHDMRVASRRLRSALDDFKPFLRQGKLRRPGRELKALADALGAVRDEDVAIHALERLAADAAPDVAAGIEMFAAARRTRREAGRAALTEAIAAERLATLQDEFAIALEKGVKAAGGKKDQGKAFDDSFRRAGLEVIAARLETMRKLSAALYHPHLIKRLHRLRIEAKRLRYAIELFAQCWGDSLWEFAKEVALMQTSLGELHDCDVWIEEFGEFLTGKQKAPGADPAATGDGDAQQRRAAVWLLRHFAKSRTHHYRDALARWHDWETSQFFMRLRWQLEAMPLIEPSPAALSPADAVTTDIESGDAH